MQTILIIMKPFTVVTLYSQGLFFEKTLLFLTKSDLVERVVILSQEPVHLKIPRCRVLVSGPLSSYKTLSLILAGIRTKYLLLLPGIQANRYKSRLTVAYNAIRAAKKK